ncbi:TetR/AcrR family transcriptional regulator [Humibacter sp. RRB41]|uniref:TetR/AcrR family transcriptional regulator n=1 Tax=Humibacter sp. RRB41 TaxID=2919946 RepID=UPI001FAA9ADC|nr:TetR/AcrR family transcriptional regulator [Humibacter sp. RRB41]
MTDGSVRRGRKPVISRERVLDAAADALANAGADSISLRAIARSLGVVSSAIYRHYSSRDELLTDLIVQTHASLGEHVTRAEASVASSDTRERFAVIVRSTRAWAGQNPHRYALIYGTPVPGYRAPQSILEPAAVVGSLIARVIADAAASGGTLPADPARDAAAPAFVPLAEAFGLEPELAPAVAEGVAVWSQLFGHLSFELFGHYVGVVDDVDAYTEFLIADMSRRLGLSRPAERSQG